MSTDEFDLPFDEEEMLEGIQEEYLEETGHELPDHVLENYQTFFALGPSAEDIRRVYRNAEKAREGRRGAPDDECTEKSQPLISITINLPFGGNDVDR
ncbi:hypothetical protein [Haloplanus halophilus]|uniref:hypothetical protein n=1 Tax=Haloplanus halophilus TaxID=2949993 RepID=UPI00203EF11F|nr:hypothetical protein [Haloplanus sp. GDY1]